MARFHPETKKKKKQFEVFGATDGKQTDRQTESIVENCRLLAMRGDR